MRRNNELSINIIITNLPISIAQVNIAQNSKDKLHYIFALLLHQPH